MKIGTSMGLMVLVAALLMGTGMAATTGTTGIGATLGSSYSITAPGAVAGWALGIGANTHDTSAAGSVSSNVAWKVQVREDTGDGKLGSTGTPADVLNSVIHATSAVGGAYDVAMTNGDQTIATGNAGDNIALDVDYTQAVISTDVQHNDYAMTLTYTVSAAP